MWKFWKLSHVFDKHFRESKSFAKQVPKKLTSRNIFLVRIFHFSHFDYVCFTEYAKGLSKFFGLHNINARNFFPGGSPVMDMLNHQSGRSSPSGGAGDSKSPTNLEGRPSSR